MKYPEEALQGRGWKLAKINLKRTKEYPTIMHEANGDLTINVSVEVAVRTLSRIIQSMNTLIVKSKK